MYEEILVRDVKMFTEVLKSRVPSEFHSLPGLEIIALKAALELFNKHPQEGVGLFAKALLDAVEQFNMKMVDQGVMELVVDEQGRFQFRSKT